MELGASRETPLQGLRVEYTGKGWMGIALGHLSLARSWSGCAEPRTVAPYHSGWCAWPPGQEAHSRHGGGAAWRLQKTK